MRRINYGQGQKAIGQGYSRERAAWSRPGDGCSFQGHQIGREQRAVEQGIFQEVGVILAYVNGSGRVILDTAHLEPLTAWAVLDHGRTRADWLFSSERLAKEFADIARLGRREIVVVSVIGGVVVRN